MKLCFSTLGCPNWTFDEIFATAKDLGLHGVEVRGIGSTIYTPDIPEFSPEQLPKTLETLRKIRMEIPLLTSGAAIALPETQEEAYRESVAYIDLAAQLGVPYVRIMATPAPEPTPGDLALAAKQFARLCAYGQDKGVMPLIETNGPLADSARMLAFLQESGHSHGGVLWDIHHTVRFFGEAPVLTCERLRPYIRHVHIKDSVLHDGKVEYRMMGYGDMPVLESLQALDASGYKGYISLEWVKRWNPELQEPAIVFAHFVNYMDFLWKTYLSKKD